MVDRAARGEAITITRAGKPVAELHPVPRRGISAEVLLAHWSSLPRVNPGQLRADIDNAVDPAP